MTRVALISDIHGNLEALEVVLRDIDSQGIDRILCLGDVIGYGPDPGPCLAHARNFEIVLMGNHEEACAHGPFGMSPIARTAIEWTTEELQRIDAAEGVKNMEFVTTLPLIYTEDDIMLVHGSPRDPTVEYVLKTDCDDLFGEVPEKIRSVFSAFRRLCFVGHSHVPGVIKEDATFLAPSEIGGRFSFDPAERYLCNVGSVGQPRDHDPRACYLILEDGASIEYRRLEYDIAATQAKIRANESIHERCAERLEQGR